MTTPNEKKCKNCGLKFTPRFLTTERVCSTRCAIEEAKKSREKKETKDWKKTKKDWKAKNKTLPEHCKELELVFNKFIRARDISNGCISCGTDLHGRKFDAGHYRSKGAHLQLRFNEDNVHGQCVHCNQHKHGNHIEYRIRLVRKIGEKKVTWLEREHPPTKFTIPEIVEMKVIYKDKVKAVQIESQSKFLPEQPRHQDPKDLFS